MTHSPRFKTNSHHILVYDITHSPSIIEKTIVFVPEMHGSVLVLVLSQDTPTY